MTPATAAPTNQRHHILDMALSLMATHGVAGTSMRRLASACGLNVATLYHYFPSKAELLSAVIADRRYLELLATAAIPVAARKPARARLVALLGTIWEGVLAEQQVWRLLVGESLRDQPGTSEVVAELTAALHSAVDRWLGDSFPELGADHRAVSAVVTGQLISGLLEHLLLPEADSPAWFQRRAEATAQVIFPD